MNGVRSFLFWVWLFALIIVMGLVCLPMLLTPRRVLTAGQRLWASAA
jgi:hypothetical protein